MVRVSYGLFKKYDKWQRLILFEYQYWFVTNEVLISGSKIKNQKVLTIGLMEAWGNACTFRSAAFGGVEDWLGGPEGPLRLGAWFPPWLGGGGT